MRKGGKKRKLNVRLKKRNQDEIESLLGGGVHSIRVIKRAQSLRLLARGERPPQVASAVGLSAKAVREIGWRYVDSGDLKGVLYEAPRPGAPPLLTDTEAQRIIAMVCSDGTSVPDAPQGRARWTVRLIAAEAVKRNLAATVGRETIRVLLKSHDLKPWREKRWCVAELTPEYIERMEDVLATYEKPLDPPQPVVCLDEKPVPLREDAERT